MTLSECNPFVRYAIIDDEDKNKAYPRYLVDNRFLYVLDGQATIKTNTNHQILKSNDFAYLPAGTCFSFERSKTKIAFICFDFTQKNKHFHRLIPSKDKICEKDIIEKPDFTDYIMLNNEIFIKNASYFKNNFLNIVDLHWKFNEILNIKCNTYLKELICTVVENSCFLINNYDENVNKVLSYINMHFNENISNTSICNEIGYHSYYMNNLVKKQTGITIHQHIINKRLNIARQLLLNTKLSIDEIAYLCGFSSQPHFSNIFKKYFKISPSKYRADFNISAI